MKKGIKLMSLGILMFSLLLMVNCDSSDENQTVEAEVDIEEAQLSSFPLFGINPVGVEITQPVIVDNKEETPGRIVITVPYTINSLDDMSTSITSEELNLSKFNVTPGNDAQLSFEGGKEHRFTITRATGDKAPLLNYVVSVVKEAAPVPEVLEITDIKFEKSKNRDLPNDIVITRRVETGFNRERIYLLFPVGTDFSSLVPTITYEGTRLYYTQDSSDVLEDLNVEFPTVDTSFDFKYPKRFFLALKNNDEDKIVTAEIILDVVKPVKMETTSITTPDGVHGTSRSAFSGVTKWINQGNQSLTATAQRIPSYENISPVIDPPYNVITAGLQVPAFGLKPGESADVNVFVENRFPELTYKTTAVFYTRINDDYNSEDLFEPTKLDITSRIISN